MRVVSTVLFASALALFVSSANAGAIMDRVKERRASGDSKIGGGKIIDNIKDRRASGDAKIGGGKVIDKIEERKEAGTTPIIDKMKDRKANGKNVIGGDKIIDKIADKKENTPIIDKIKERQGEGKAIAGGGNIIDKIHEKKEGGTPIVDKIKERQQNGEGVIGGGKIIDKIKERHQHSDNDDSPSPDPEPVNNDDGPSPDPNPDPNPPTPVTPGSGGSQAKDLISLHEGYEQCVYTDTTGHKTIGIGFNLERGDAPSIIQSVGADFDAVYNGGQCLTDGQINDIFSGDLNIAKSGAQSCVSSFKDQCDDIQSVLIDLSFNLGEAGLCEFGTFIGQINSNDYASAAADLKTTLWCSQVGNRCTDDTDIISYGC